MHTYRERELVHERQTNQHQHNHSHIDTSSLARSLAHLVFGVVRNTNFICTETLSTELADCLTTNDGNGRDNVDDGDDDDDVDDCTVIVRQCVLYIFAFV